MNWKKLQTDIEIDLQETLFSGQVFHFRMLSTSVFGGVLQETVVFLKQVGKEVHFLDSDSRVREILVQFFNLDVVTELDCQKKGLRFLTNGIIPTIFSFICSSNNNIKRITKMVEYLYSKGTPIKLAEDAKSAICGDDDWEMPQFYTFPPVQAYIGCEAELRNQGFGYRAKFLARAAEFLDKNHLDWTSMSYQEAQAALLQIPGIGRKVADCICLISLKFFHAVPIDTHILKYTNIHFGTTITHLNKGNYEYIQNLWMCQYGKHAGIAQLYAFKDEVDSYYQKRLKRSS